jgi:ADP-ribose pyrophosphatase
MNTEVRILESTLLVQGKKFDVVREKIRTPNGKTTERETVIHPGAAVFLPQLSNGDLVLVRQYRHALRRTQLEIPAGTLDPGEDGITCARREIREETGYEAREWLDVGIMYPAPGFCNEVHHCFIARDLVPAAQNLDDDEIIQVERMSIPSFQAAVASGEIVDAKTIALFYRAKLKGLL